MSDKEIVKWIEESNYIGFQSFKTFSEYEEFRNPIIDFMHPRERRMQINKNWFLIGRDFYDPFDRRSQSDKLFLPFGGEVFRLTMFGKLRSGKSMTIRRLGDIAFLNGYHVVYLTDVKNEMRTSKHPQHPEIARHLDSSDIVQGFPTKVYRPIFFQEFFGETIPEDNEWFQLPYSIDGRPVADWIDIQKLLGLKPKDDKAINELSLHWQEVNNLEELKEIIQKKMNGKMIAKPVGDKLLRAIEPLIKYKIFGTEATKDIIKDMLGNIVVFNMRGYERLAGDSTLSSTPAMYVKIIQKLIVDAKESKKLPNRVLMVIDEAPVFLKGDSLTAREIENTVKRQTHLGIYIVFAAQDVKDVPDWVLTMSRYLLFPYNFEQASAKKLLETINLSNPSGTWVWNREISEILGQMKLDEKTKQRQWCLLDTQKKKATIFWALPSLSQHLLTGV